VVPTKHCANAALQKLCSARQAPDQIVTSFDAYIVTTSKGTDTTDYNKHMFFLTRLRPEIHAAIRKGEDHLTFDSCLESGVKAETALRLDAEYNKAFKFAQKDKAQEKARKGKGKARNDLLKSRIMRNTPQRSRGGFYSHGHGRGCGGHGHYCQGDARSWSAPAPGQWQGLRQAGPLGPGLQN
jgi:hypothetical protein